MQLVDMTAFKPPLVTVSPLTQEVTYEEVYQFGDEFVHSEELSPTVYIYALVLLLIMLLSALCLICFARRR